MMRLHRLFGYPLILGAALAITRPTLHAADPEKPEPAAPATAKDLDRMEKALQKMGDAIARDINGLRKDFELHIKKTQNDIDSLNAKVEQLRKDLDALRKGQPTVSNYGPNAKEIDEVRKQLDQLQQTLNAVRAQLPQTSTSLRPADSGVVRLVNDYLFGTEVIVNGAGYYLEPGMTREVRVPAGTFSYRVPTAATGDQTRALAPNEMYTIRVYPR